MNIPIEKQKGFIEEFKNVRPDYIDFAKLLEAILNKAVEKLASLALVQARPKGIVSFSNKIISKDKYKNPLTDMTDLCGARVIVHFQSHVEKICKFIKENFEIDEANSLDLKSKLKVNEFGYRSVHYIVTPKQDNILGVHIDNKFKSMKAEIQVRTLAEHVWADISHDRIYKTDLIIPEEWKREAARLSAILENADITFAKMSNDIDSVSMVYELQYETGKSETEIEKLNTLISVLNYDVDECVKNSLKLSSIYRAKDQYIKAKDLLEPLLDKTLGDPFLKGKLFFEYGYVLAMSTGCDIHTPDYNNGLKNIHQGLIFFEGLTPELRKENERELSYFYYRLGQLQQRNEEESRELAEYFTRAYNIMPSNPLYLVALVESLILRNIDIAKYNISLYNANLYEAITKLEELIEIGIKKVPAWFAIGHCYLMLNDEYKCINAYSKAVEALLNSTFLTSHSSISAEIALISKFKAINSKLSEEIKLFLNIAMFIISDTNNRGRYKNFLENHKIKKEAFKIPIVIVAGGASQMDENKVFNYDKFIKELMHNFKGTIISGGTTAGIPGLVGQMKSKIEKDTSVEFDLCAYLPGELPEDAVVSNFYTNIYKTNSNVFSALDILSCWADLISNGINPSEVVLIGIDGGEIASMEYRIALALGAKVGLISYSGRAASDFLQDKTWKNHANLLQLPNDPYTVWALVNQSAETKLTKSEIEELASKVHEYYRLKKIQKFRTVETDINKYKVIMEWDNLDPMLQRSNRLQVAFYENILRRVGLSIRKSENPTIVNIKDIVSKDNYEKLATLEHARWNAERLLDGWKYGESKNIDKKLNPCILSWEQLDDETKGYDFDPVNNMPILFAEIGYEIFSEKIYREKV